MKKKWFVLVPLIAAILAIVMMFSITRVTTSKVNKVNLEVEECYQMLDDNPFREGEVRIKVMAIKGNYVQYYYLTAPSFIHSSAIYIMDKFFWIPCPEGGE